MLTDRHFVLIKLSTQLLRIAGVALLLLASGYALALSPRAFSAVFSVPGGAQVHLDFVDELNFKFSVANGDRSTVVVDGKIFLHLLDSYANAKQRVLYIGRLRSKNEAERSRLPPLPQLARAPIAVSAKLGHPKELGRVEIERAGPLDTKSSFLIARVPELAQAQYSITRTLVPAMDMGLCGDAVRLLSDWWPQQITGRGFAVLWASSGVRVETEIAPLRTKISIPVGVLVEDYALNDRREGAAVTESEKDARK
jgi:hypothetical protein